MKRYLSCFIILVTLNVSHSQINKGEIARLEYKVIPNLGDNQIDTYSINLNMGTKLNKGFLGFGIDYKNYGLVFDNRVINFDASNFTSIHLVSLRLAYIKNLSKSWSLAASFSPQLSSNLENKINKEDFQYNSFLSFKKKYSNGEKKSSLRLGIAFASIFGKPRFIPIINYTKHVDEKFSYSVGLPETGLYYNLNAKHKLSFVAKPEGFYSNSSSKVFFDNYGSVDNAKIQFSAINLDLEYNILLDNNWLTSLKLGHIPVSSLRMYNSSGDKLETIATNKSVTISMGLKFKLNKKNEKNRL